MDRRALLYKAALQCQVLPPSNFPEISFPPRKLVEGYRQGLPPQIDGSAQFSLVEAGLGG